MGKAKRKSSQPTPESVNPLDTKRIRFWVEQFGEALDLPELWKDIEKLL